MHEAHAFPLPPQAAVSVPTLQAFPWQQPAGQFPGPQPVCDASHEPLLEQDCPATQVLHAAPEAPHASEAVPPMQTPEAEQQPEQPEPQGCVPLHAANNTATTTATTATARMRTPGKGLALMMTSVGH